MSLWRHLWWKRVYFNVKSFVQQLKEENKKLNVNENESEDENGNENENVNENENENENEKSLKNEIVKDASIK